MIAAKKKSGDIVLSLIALGASLIAALLSYREIVAAEIPNQHTRLRLLSGNQEYQLLNGSQCVGTASTRLTHSKGYQLSAEADVLGSYRGNTFPITIRANAAFNPIGQLHDADLSLNSAESEIGISSSEVNPVKISLAGSGPRGGFSYELRIPGPVSLRRYEAADGEESFFVEHPLLDSAQSALSLPLLSATLQPYELKLVAAADDQSSCPAPAALDITALSDALNALPGSFPLKQGRI